MKRNGAKIGAIMSYILIFLNTAYGLIVMPYILSQVGSSDYGVYRTISSLSSSLTVLDLGFSGTVLRFVAKYNAENNRSKINEFLGMALIQTFIVFGLVTVVGGGLFFGIDPIYSAKFSPNELHLAKQLYLILIVNIGLTFFENVFFGVIAGHNEFGFSNGIKILLLIAKTAAIYLFLPIFQSVIVVVAAQTILTALAILAYLLFIYRKLKVRFVFGKWDKALFKESFGYTILLFAQSVVIQFNGNIDNMVIGAVKGSQMVTVYSFAITIYNMYEQLSSSISGVMLPTVTNRIHSGATSRDLEDLVIRVGKIQFMILGAILCGFFTLGKEFFMLWLGEGFDDCYFLALILMIPVTIPLIQNVCISILRAKNLMAFRTISLLYSTVINVIATVVGTILYGYYAAAIGTALSTIIGSIISMNIYYHRKLGMNVFRMFFCTVKDVIPALLCATALTLLGKGFIYRQVAGKLLPFILCGAIFIAVYFVILFFFNRRMFKDILRKRKNTVLKGMKDT